MASELIPTTVAVAALKKTAAELRGANVMSRVSDHVAERRELVAGVLMDLVSNIEVGATELRRTDSGMVFITTTAIESAS